MKTEQVWAALARGGATVQSRVQSPERLTDLALGKYNSLLDPVGAETMANALAERLGEQAISVVVV